MSAPRIGIGISQFRELREKGCYYVDKTDFISAFLASPGAEVSLITMPEHFGKSLAMSMLADFLDNQKDSTAIFAGLKITGNRALCEKWMNKWPVISLNFKHMGASSFPEALKQISRAVSYAVRQHMYVFQSDVLDEDQINELVEMKKGTDDIELLESSLELLSIALYLIHKKEVFVLIDEYDVPLASALKNGYYDLMLPFMHNILGNVLKDNEYLEFGILTGFINISKTSSSYTGFNTIKHYDKSNNRFADKIGFTIEEVDQLLYDTGFSHKKDELISCINNTIYEYNNEIYSPLAVLQYIDALQKKIIHDSI